MLLPNVDGEGETKQLHVQHGVTLIFYPKAIVIISFLIHCDLSIHLIVTFRALSNTHLVFPMWFC
jgi:hypothetical protein